MPPTPKTPADQQTSAPSPSPDSERYAARAAAPKAVARLYSESRVAEKRANQAEREATSLRRTIDASSEIARRRNALLRNGGSWLQRGGDDGAEAPKGGGSIKVVAAAEEARLLVRERAVTRARARIAAFLEWLQSWRSNMSSERSFFAGSS